jgi:ectoine hydroxylase-related dioxygenase (phytanoyl-CoA dioxygenase family)
MGDLKTEVAHSRVAGVASTPREVSDAEVECYEQNGWVKLERFIPEELAAELLAQSRQLFAAGEGNEVAGSGDLSTGRRGGQVVDVGTWQDYHFVARDDRAEPFSSLAFSPEIGRAAQRLIGREVPVRYHSDMLACKMPVGEAGSKPTAWHQDFPIFPFDRYGSLAFWVALDDVPAERGAMRFLSGSHREGPMGRCLVGGGDLLAEYPHLADKYPLSDLLDLRAGDATAHHAGVIHGAPQNTTAEPRWALILAYFPDDALYTGASHHNFNDKGLELNARFEHRDFPVVYR